jgi:hypothetical protein
MLTDELFLDQQKDVVVVFGACCINYYIIYKLLYIVPICH